MTAIIRSCISDGEDADPVYYYRVSGWTLTSDRALPYLIPAPPGAADIIVRFRPFVPEGAAPLASISGFRIFSPSLAEFSTEDGFQARISAGREIWIDAPASITDAEIQTLLFGRCFGMLCQQRGWPPLHACGVWMGRGAVAVAGNSGVGKSTTARALMQRGFDLLTDDQLIYDPATGLAHACIPSNKLSRNSAEALGEALDPAQQVLRGVDKFHAPAPQFRTEPAPLRAIFLLAPRVGLTEPALRRLSPAEAVVNLDPCIVRRDAAQALGTSALVFRWLSEIAGTVPVYGVWRPDDLGSLDRLTDRLIEVAASHGAL